jgi:hypothetical protein
MNIQRQAEGWSFPIQNERYPRPQLTHCISKPAADQIDACSEAVKRVDHENPEASYR